MKNIKYGFLCFVPTVLLLLFWDFLPEKVATHFNFYGNADIYSSGWYVILLVPFLGFVCHTVYMIIIDKKPDWINKTGRRKYAFLYFPILTWITIILMLKNS